VLFYTQVSTALSEPATTWAACETRAPKRASNSAISDAGFAALNRKLCTWLEPSARGQSSWSVASTPFGRGGDVGTAAKAGDRAHDRDAIGALDKVLHERAVDIDLVGRNAVETASRHPAQLVQDDVKVAGAVRRCGEYDSFKSCDG